MEKTFNKYFGGALDSNYKKLVVAAAVVVAIIVAIIIIVVVLKKKGGSSNGNNSVALERYVVKLGDTGMGIGANLKLSSTLQEFNIIEGKLVRPEDGMEVGKGGPLTAMPQLDTLGWVPAGSGYKFDTLTIGSQGHISTFERTNSVALDNAFQKVEENNDIIYYNSNAGNASWLVEQVA